ncbi:hypothetical protein DV737_g778, partial [Chaetothyriales sp. CBS 132003]
MSIGTKDTSYDYSYPATIYCVSKEDPDPGLIKLIHEVDQHFDSKASSAIKIAYIFQIPPLPRVGTPQAGQVAFFLAIATSDLTVETESALAPKEVWTNADMDPVPPEHQTWTLWTWMAYWATDTVNLGTWETASSVIAVGLNWRDAIPIMVVGTSCIAVPMVLNGAIGAKLHIPFSVIVRSGFGYYFAYFCIFSRAVLACFWLGIQGANGALCITIMLTAIWPSYADIKNHLPTDAGISTKGMISYFLFWIIQLPLLLIPPTRLQWLFAIKLVAAPVTAIATLGWIVHKAGGGGAIFSVPETVHGSERAWLWLSCMSSVTGSWATLACNIPDFSRYARSPKGQYIQLPFLPFVFTICGVMGIVTTSASKVVYGEFLWNPLDIISQWLDSKGGRAAAFFAALSWYVAQVGTNITANSISAANDMTVMCPRFINIKRGCILAALIGGWMIVPWKILSSATTFLAFMGGYAVFLAPMAGIMAADYWIVKRQRIDVPGLYDPHGRYRYNKAGINWRAMLAFVLAVGPCLPGLAYSINSSTNISEGAKRLYTIDWLYGFLTSIFVYSTTSYIFKPKDQLVLHTVYGIPKDGAGAEAYDEAYDEKVLQRDSLVGNPKGFSNINAIDEAGSASNQGAAAHEGVAVAEYVRGVDEKVLKEHIRRLRASFSTGDVNCGGGKWQPFWLSTQAFGGLAAALPGRASLTLRFVVTQWLQCSSVQCLADGSSSLMSSNPFRRSSFKDAPSTGTARAGGRPDASGTGPRVPLSVNTRVASSSQPKHVEFASPPAVPIPPASYPSSPESTRQSPGFHAAFPATPTAGSAVQGDPFDQDGWADEDDGAIEQAQHNTRINTERASYKAVQRDAVKDTLSRFASGPKNQTGPAQETAKREKQTIDVDAFTRLLLTGESTARVAGDASSADTASLSQRSVLDAAAPSVDETPGSSIDQDRQAERTHAAEPRRRPPPPKSRYGKPTSDGAADGTQASETSSAPPSTASTASTTCTVSTELADASPSPALFGPSAASASELKRRPPTPPLARRKSQNRTATRAAAVRNPLGGRSGPDEELEQAGVNEPTAATSSTAAQQGIKPQQRREPGAGAGAGTAAAGQLEQNQCRVQTASITSPSLAIARHGPAWTNSTQLQVPPCCKKAAARARLPERGCQSANLSAVPPPPSDPATPNEMGPGTPNSATTSMSALSVLKERSTVGSASATGSVAGTRTWASESLDYEADKMSESQDDGVSSVGGVSDEDKASLVGFGEGAGSTVSGPVSTPSARAVAARGLVSAATPRTAPAATSSGQSTPMSGMVDGMSYYDASIVDSTVPPAPPVYSGQHGSRFSGQGTSEAEDSLTSRAACTTSISGADEAEVTTTSGPRVAPGVDEDGSPTALHGPVDNVDVDAHRDGKHESAASDRGISRALDMAVTTQFACAVRTLKGIGVVNAAPSYEPPPAFDPVSIIDADSGQTISSLPADNVFELAFSPLGTYIITWQRPSKDDKGDAVKNLKVWLVIDQKAAADGVDTQTVGRFVQKSQTGWNLQYTYDEKFCARVVTNEVQIYHSHDLTQVWNKLRVEGVTDFAVSPGKHHSIAVFIPERKGQPAAVRVYNVPNFTVPVSQKTFFKGDKVQLKWNDNGTSLIVLAQTEVDKTGKSYYGETTLYILSANGGFDSRVGLDKDGPIHDVSWSPTSTSFAVVYGYMPAKTVIFNAKAQPVHTFPLGPRNTVLFSPHGRLVLVAGFGNLAGQMDIYDLERDVAKVCTIEASNASVCEWSPDGRHILTATTSPRLRVDNGIRIWHAGGPLMFNADINDLYHVAWRPRPPSAFPLGASPFSPIPAPHASATSYLSTKKTPSKPAGAYRPPGARGQVTPLAFKREDEGGAAYVRDSSSSFSANINGFGKPRARQVPGAEPTEERTPLPPGAAPGGGVSLTGTGEGADSEQLSKAAKKNAKKRGAKKAAAAAAKEQQGPDALVAGTQAQNPSSHPGSRSPNRSPDASGRQHQRQGSNVRAFPPASGLDAPDGAHIGITAPTPTTPGAPTSTEKKIRGLLKKIRAIEDLKMRLASGEKLEDTQMRKIASEDGVRKELKGLGYAG